jgi:hypothetical protein
MKIELIHRFKNRCHNLKDLLEDCQKISTFCNKLEKQSVLYPNRYSPEKYKGDGLEFLVEALLKLSPIDNRIGIGNYEPVLENDTGVDGIGIGIDGNPATVQVKYRKSNYILTSNGDHLSNFVVASQNRYGVSVESNKNMLIITTGKGLHHYTEEDMFLNKVRCIGYEDLRDLLDNNFLFWENFRKISLK